MGTFRVGLAMAGAVSAGAYSAGVLDFLIEALDAWQEAKAQGKNVPRHDVMLECASGASAGSMCAAIFGIALPYRFPHVSLKTPVGTSDAAKNPFYKAWVDSVDITSLLDTGDLRHGDLDAFLNCEVIDRTLAQTLQYRAGTVSRPYLRNPFAMRFTVGNLRGVPYGVAMRGLQAAGDGMYEHEDYMGFVLAQPSPAVPQPATLGGHASITLPCDPTTAGWRAFAEAAAASGAFPLFLKARQLNRPRTDYDERHAVIKDNDTVYIGPSWGAADPPKYDFVAVDGGVYNNEPFDLAHEIVAGPGGSNRRKGHEADAAVIMLDPFVDAAHLPRRLTSISPMSLLMPLVGGWVNQSRFRVRDLELALDEDIYSRFLVAPSNPGAPPNAHPLASGGLSGFLGFFHRDFREHDYYLGRRNCQQFLRKHFTLKHTNPIVVDGYRGLEQEYLTAEGELPIIPLMPELGVDEPAPVWPAHKLNLQALMPAIEKRVDAVYETYKNQAVESGSNWFIRRGIAAYLWVGWKLVRGKLVAAIQQQLSAAVGKQKLA